MYNFFKYDKEFYKFHYETIGSIKLINRYANLKPTSKLYSLNVLPKLEDSNFKVSFRLVSSNLFAVNDLFELNESTGVLRLKSQNLTFDAVKSELNEDFEMTLYALARVGPLEYMCEIQVDFKALFNQHERPQTPPNHTSDGVGLAFGRALHTLKLNENTRINTVIFKFVAITTDLGNDHKN